MRGDMDIEETLKRFEGHPGPDVKPAIMARFSRRFGIRRPVPHKTAFWKRSIPIYAAAVVVVAAAGLSFVAGRRTTVAQQAPGAFREPGRALNAGAAPEIMWEAAPNDLL